MTVISTTTASKPHILVFPYPAQGHLLPLLDLTHQLALHGLTITILVTPKNLSSLDQLLLTHPNSIKTLVLPFPPHPKVPLGVENVKDMGTHGNAPVIAALSKLREPVIEWFRAQPSPPRAILSDYFLGWTHHLALELNVPRVTFFSSSAFSNCASVQLWLNMDNVRKLDVVKFTDLPRSPSFPMCQMSTMFTKFRDGDLDWEIVKDGMLANLESFGVVFNSFSSLEGDYLDHMKKLLGHEKVYGVGPLRSNLGLIRPKEDSVIRTDDGELVLDWLEKCPKESVLYVCFGSQKFMSPAQMEGLGLGLEKSGARFIWVVKNEVPNGFEDRVRGRALVVKGWVPQVDVLSHKSIGGFLSHCGWNSMLEGIVAGVMILAWPMEADQFVNARLLVEDMGVAIGVCEGTNSVPDSGELARVIGKTMGETMVQKERAKALRIKALEAVQIGGSSMRDLQDFFEILSQV